MRLKFLLLMMLAAVTSVSAVETSVWQMGSFAEFLKGRSSDVSITQEGDLSLAPAAQVVFNPGEALALSLAADQSHHLFIGTGHQGKVFRVDASGKASLFFTAPEPDIFALAVGPQGALYAGSSPEGKIYRVTPDGKSSVFYDPKTKYIWALAFDSQGHLYAGTGDKGQIFRIDSDGQGKLFFNSNQTHIMCLAFDSKGNVLAGSVPDGLIYRIAPDGKAFVIYQSSLPEIHELATDAHGNLYAAALGTGGPPGVPGILVPGQVPQLIPAQPMTVTVTGSAPSLGASEAVAAKTQKPAPANPGQTAPSFIHSALPPTFGAMQFKPQSRGALIEISPDSAVQTLWSSETESAYGLAIRGKQVLFSTDSNGQIYELNPSQDGGNLTLLTETHESIATRLMLEGKNLYVATSNVGELLRLGMAPAEQGTYESPVKDTKFISHWGVMAWRGDVPPGSSIEFYARSGNSGRPDQTWSDWSGPYHDSNGSAIQCPPARYLQWKAVFRTSGDVDPRLEEVSVAYLNQNLPPQIHSVNVTTATERTSAAGGAPTNINAAAAAMAAAGTFTFTSPSLPGTPAGTRTPLIISWQADDPNNDALLYSVYVKSTDEREWHLLKDRLDQPSYTIEPATLADGEYVARIVASDSPSNPPGMARQSEMLSAPFWVDNTPPSIQTVEQAVHGDKGVVKFKSEDPVSPLRSAEYQLDSGHWIDVLSDEGIVDSRVETFTIELPGLKPGEHVLMLRTYDSAGNAGVGKAVLEVPRTGAAEP